MDNTQRTGVLLILLVLVAYVWYSTPSEAEIARHEFVQDSLAQVKLQGEQTLTTKPTEEAIINSTDSVAISKLNDTHGPFAAAMVGDNQEVSVENNLIKLTFSSKGGIIKSAQLKEHFKITEDEEKNQTKSQLVMLNDEKNKFEYLIPTRNHGVISSQKLNFTPTVSGNTVTMTAQLQGGQSIVQKYVLQDSSFQIDHALQFNGMDQLVDAQNPKLKFRWHNYLDKLELNENFERYYATVYFKESGESSDYCNCRSDDLEEIDEKPIEWISHVNQFFNTSIIAKNKKFENGRFETIALEKEDKDLKLIKTEAEIPLDLVSNESLEYSIYIGPNEFNNLTTYNNGLEEIIPFGRSIFGTINRWIIRPAFNFLSGFIGSKGVVIIVLIFILKMLLYPLMYKMLHSQAKMGLLKPKIAGIKEKYPDDSQKVQVETMKMYREYGVSPLGGCMPMILQMPIWYALFRFFPASITFRQEPFLWATDLSSYDALINLPFSIPAFGSHLSLFTLLWAVTTIIYSYYNMRHMDMSANPAMKYIQYFMPVTFLFFFNTYASGLTCYMFFSNVFNIAQTVITKKFVFQDEKLQKELDEHKAKPKKAGGFGSRLEEAMKQQQALAKKRTNEQTKKKKRK